MNNPVEQIMKMIDDNIAPDQMTRKEAIDFLDEILNGIEIIITALKDEIRSV